jgi:hypothetical protein
LVPEKAAVALWQVLNALHPEHLLMLAVSESSCSTPAVFGVLSDASYKPKGVPLI